MLGTGDVLALNIENELDYLVSNYLESPFGIVYGRGFVDYKSFSNTFIQGNINLAFLPLDNKKKYVLKLGLGLS